MKTLEKIAGFLYGIKVLFLDFMLWLKKQTEFYIAILAAVVWFLFWTASFFLGTESYPVGMFQKAAFGVLVMSVFQGISWFQLKKTNPFYANLLDPDSPGGIKNLTEWQQVKVGLFYWSFYVAGAVVLASLY